MPTIYVVEDDKNIREIETFALTNVGYQVEDFECAKDFYARIAEKNPDLVLLDVMLPDEDGLEIVKGLDIGADDYMTKPFGIMELISRVKALLRRSGAQESEDKILRIGKVELDSERHTVSVDGVPCELTYKEYELLKLLMKHAGIVTTREVILDRVWGTDFEGESRTLDMHIKTLRQKLRESGGLIRTVRNVGYIMSDSEA